MVLVDFPSGVGRGYPAAQLIAGADGTLGGDEILVAAGRLPNLEPLNLEAAGVVYNKRGSDLIIPWATYTDPEVAHVGMYDWEAEKADIPVDTYVQALAETDRGRTDGEEGGFVKVHVKKTTDKILGATIVGRHAGALISEVTVAMTGGLGLRHLATVIHPYPTEAEAIRKMADAYNRTRLTPTVAKLFKWWFGWRR